MEIKIWIEEWFKINTNIESSIIEKNVSQDYFSLGWIDSLKFIQLISDIENNFKIVFLNDEFQKKSFTTVEGLTKIVEEKVNEKL